MNNEIKPVYRCKVFEGADWIYLEKFPKERESSLIIEALYPASAYEYMKNSADELLAENNAILGDNEKLKADNAAQAKKISELEDRLSSFPIPTSVAMQKISNLRQRGFKEYAATVLKSQSDGYCIVGDYGDVRWITVYCEEPKEG